MHRFNRALRSTTICLKFGLVLQPSAARTHFCLGLLLLATMLVALPASASILYLEVQGVVGSTSAQNSSDPAGEVLRLQTVRNALDGNGNPLPPPSFPSDYQQTLIPVNTPVSVLFAIDTSRLPTAQTVGGGNLSATFGPSSLSHFEDTLQPWVSITLQTDGLTFGSQLSNANADPLGAFPFPPFGTTVSGAPNYFNLLSYGEQIFGGDFRQEAFRTTSSATSSFSATRVTPDTNILTVFSFQSLFFDMRLLQSGFGAAASFLENPSELPVNFQWTSDLASLPPGASTFGELFMSWNSSFASSRLEGDVTVQEFDVLFANLGVQVTSVRAYTTDPAPIPEPATLGLSALALAALRLLRRRVTR